MNKGNLYLCMTCAYQEHIPEEEKEHLCIHWPEPAIEGGSCHGYRLLPSQLLGERLAELYEMMRNVTELALELAEAFRVHLELEKEEQP